MARPDRPEEAADPLLSLSSSPFLSAPPKGGIFLYQPLLIRPLPTLEPVPLLLSPSRLSSLLCPCPLLSYCLPILLLSPAYQHLLLSPAHPRWGGREKHKEQQLGGRAQLCYEQGAARLYRLPTRTRAQRVHLAARALGTAWHGAHGKDCELRRRNSSRSYI